MANQQDWQNGTWAGSRRAKIRRDLKLSVRERLQNLEQLIETSQKLSSLRLLEKEKHQDTKE